MSYLWTPEEVEYLERYWGEKSIPKIAKKVNRSTGAVKLKARKIGLAAFRQSGDYITVNALMGAMRNTNWGASYTAKQWIDKGLPVKQKEVELSSFRVINIEKFWNWAKENRTLIDFSKMDRGILGKEPEWVNEQRMADESLSRFKKTPWSASEDNLLKSLLRHYKYGYRDISERLNRTESAIKRRILDLNLKERPLKAYNHNKWTKKEVDVLIEMYEKGYQSDVIKERIERSALSIRGKIERMVSSGQLKPRNEFRKTC